MATDVEQSPFGRAVAVARKARGLNVRQAAAEAGISEGRWRQLEAGYSLHGGGVRIPARPKTATVLAVSRVVGLDSRRAFKLAGLPVPEDLLAEMEHQRQDSVGPDGHDAEEEILFRLPPGLTPRQRETARQLGRQSIETYLQSLGEE